MSVLNLKKRGTDIVQVWNGVKFDYIARTAAQKLEKEGLLQISTGLQAKDLKAADEFGPKKSKTYKTREMKAEDE